MINFTVPESQLSGLVEQIVRKALSEVRQLDDRGSDRLCYSEAEAAGLLGLERHVLRDLRQRGEIAHSKGPGKRILYRREHLETYLLSREVKAKK